MNNRNNARLDTYYQMDIAAWKAIPGIMPVAHVHTDLEVNYLLRGALCYFMGGRFQVLEPGRLTVFWAGMPHRLVEVRDNPEYICMTLPLAWFLQWDIAEPFTQRLLRGELVQEPELSSPVAAMDRARLELWAADLVQPSPEMRKSVSLEVESRFRRLAAQLEIAPASRPQPIRGHTAQAKIIEEISRYISEHYRDIESIAEIAEAVGLHPNYAMQIFKQGCGLTLWEYVIRLRISHAQRLLMTTDFKIQRIADECGFYSLNRFYDAFRRVCGRTPSEFRKQ